jgi:hypothetical protein
VGGFRGLFAILGKVLLRLALPVLLLDELITTFQGGDTLITRAIDSIFGAGSTAKVVAWFKNAFRETKAFVVGIIKEFREAWQGSELFRDALAGLAGGIAGLVVALKLIAAGKAAYAVASGIAAAAQTAFNGALALGAKTAAIAQAAFVPLLATLAAVAAAYAAVDQWQKLSKESGGAGGVWEGVKSFVGGEGFFAGVDKTMNEKARKDAAARKPKTASVQTMSAPASTQQMASMMPTQSGPVSNQQTMQASTTVNVNVPPSTPAQLAQNVGQAAGKAVTQSNRAAFNAVAFRPG